MACKCSHICAQGDNNKEHEPTGLALNDKSPTSREKRERRERREREGGRESPKRVGGRTKTIIIHQPDGIE